MSKQINSKVIGLLISSICFKYALSQGPYPPPFKINTVKTITAESPDFSFNKVTANYLDGLGRQVQTVVLGGSMHTNGNPTDLVTSFAYDPFGRISTEYLPFGSSTSDGNFKSGASNELSSFMQTQFATQNEANFYYQTDYEPSPLNRINKKSPPGVNWVGSGAGVSTERGVNINDDDVKKWNVSGGFYSMVGSYPAGELYTSTTTDENGNLIFEFKDKDGDIILRRVQLTYQGYGHNGCLNTYFIYDEIKNLRCIIQPEGVKQLIGNSWDLNPSILNEQCFLYAYDSRNRVISKKIPGSGYIQMQYDDRDRLIMWQDANLAGQGKWLVTKYDNMNRVIETGLGPSIFSYDILTKTHYDDYNDLPAGLNSTFLTDWNSFFNGNTNTFPYAVSPTQSNDYLKGLVTWSQSRILGSNPAEFITNVFIYDDEGRIIQQHKTNITGGVDISTNQYTWTGKLLVNIEKIEKLGNNSEAVVIVTRNVYDELGRITKVENKVSSPIVNGGNMPGSFKTIAVYEYDRLGQLKTKHLGTNPTDNNPLESVNYEYNVRGWLLGANRDYVRDNNNNHFFGFDLGYDKMLNNLIGNHSYLNSQLNGNISGTVWKSKGDGEKRKYDFSYDKANRILKADFSQYTGYAFDQSSGLNYNLKMGDGIDPLSAYDANGNIKRMQQWGHKLGGSVQIDDLTYTYPYAGNKLLKVEDANSDPQTKLGDFNDGTNGFYDDYFYDNNGNLLIDNNKAVSIGYNYLNLPAVVSVTGKGSIGYTYDAHGNKLKKTVNDDLTSTQNITLYLNNLVYQNDTLQSISHEEGRIRLKTSDGTNPATLEYDFMLKDHLGNVRSLITEEQRTDMYPAATMEDDQASVEEMFYSNLPPTRYGPSGNRVARLIGNEPGDDGTTRIGPGIVLKVMAGDKFNLMVDSWIDGMPLPNFPPPTNPLLDIINLFSNSVANLNQGHPSSPDLQNSVELTNSVTSFLADQNTASGDVRAFINWLLLDERFNYVSSSSGFQHAGQTIVLTDMPIDKSGYLYIFTSNATPDWNANFDNLQVTHIRGSLLEENHYYPFGLIQHGLSSTSLNFGKENRVRFNGYEQQSKEFSDNSGLEWYDYKNRFYDNQIGRFFVQDRLANEYVYYTPYQFAGNEVPNAIDLDGLEPLRLTDSGIMGPSDNLKVPKGAFGPEWVAPPPPGGVESKQGFSTFLDLLPGVGQIKGLIEGVTGEDLITGTKLSTSDRALGLIPIAGKGGKLVDGIQNNKTLQKSENAITKGEKSSTDFVVTEKGEAIALPNGVTGPHTPKRGTGMVYTDGSGGKGMDKRVTGVRIMDANKNQGRRVNYMNKNGHTVDPKTGVQISPVDPRGHLKLKE